MTVRRTADQPDMIENLTAWQSCERRQNIIIQTKYETRVLFKIQSVLLDISVLVVKYFLIFFDICWNFWFSYFLNSSNNKSASHEKVVHIHLSIGQEQAVFFIFISFFDNTLSFQQKNTIADLIRSSRRSPVSTTSLFFSLELLIF